MKSLTVAIALLLTACTTCRAFSEPCLCGGATKAKFPEINICDAAVGCQLKVLESCQRLGDCDDPVTDSQLEHCHFLCKE